MPNKVVLGSYFLVLLIFSVYSYAFVDPNLVLSDNLYFWRFQQAMWQFSGQHSFWSVVVYTGLIIALFGFYGYWLKQLSNPVKAKPIFMKLIGVSVAGLMLSYPALSHDVFNYAMNAKMVWQYQENPHVSVALDFPSDPWLRFMHNVHTPAPYAYGWTIFSVPFGFIGGNNIKLNLLAFRFLMVVAYLGLGWILFNLQKIKTYWSLALFMLNPLVLIETITNIHNDVVMMLLELLSILLIWKGWLKHSGYHVLTGMIIFLCSVSIKYASLMLLPGLLFYLVTKKLKARMDFGGVLAVTHFLPLLSSRSQRFLPWYLIWPLTFMPLTDQTLIQKTLIIISFSALLSYVPYLYYLEFSPEQQWQRFWLLFGIPLIYLVFQLGQKIRLKFMKI